MALPATGTSVPAFDAPCPFFHVLPSDTCSSTTTRLDYQYEKEWSACQRSNQSDRNFGGLGDRASNQIGQNEQPGTANCTSWQHTTMVCASQQSHDMWDNQTDKTDWPRYSDGSTGCQSRQHNCQSLDTLGFNPQVMRFGFPQRKQVEWASQQGSQQ
jgi:hypothetical protein